MLRIEPDRIEFRPERIAFTELPSKDFVVLSDGVSDERLGIGIVPSSGGRAVSLYRSSGESIQSENDLGPEVNIEL